jgi:hypothetical protein
MSFTRVKNHCTSLPNFPPPGRAVPPSGPRRRVSKHSNRLNQIPHGLGTLGIPCPYASRYHLCHWRRRFKLIHDTRPPVAQSHRTRSLHCRVHVPSQPHRPTCRSPGQVRLAVARALAAQAHHGQDVTGDDDLFVGWNVMSIQWEKDVDDSFVISLFQRGALDGSSRACPMASAPALRRIKRRRGQGRAVAGAFAHLRAYLITDSHRLVPERPSAVPTKPKCRGSTSRVTSRR